MEGGGGSVRRPGYNRAGNCIVHIKYPSFGWGIFLCPGKESYGSGRKEQERTRKDKSGEGNTKDMGQLEWKTKGDRYECVHRVLQQNMQ